MTDWEPTEERWHTIDVVAKLPIGSIIKGDAGMYGDRSDYPITKTGQDRFVLSGSVSPVVMNLAEMAEGRYLVLFVPRPPVPPVGAELTKTDLEWLPDRAVIIDDNGLVAQVSVFGRDGDSRSYNGPICSGDESEDPRGIWMAAKRPIKLLHLVDQK